VNLALPTSGPDGLAAVRIVPELALPGGAWWDLWTVQAGLSRSDPSYDDYLSETTGSSYDWSDEFRFDLRTGLLSSLVLKTPEDGTADAEVTETWSGQPRRPGLPELVDRTRAFHVDPLDLRGLSGDGRHLIATDRQLGAAGSGSLRLAVHPALDLLFQDGRYRGWMVIEPLAHLVINRDDAPVPGSAPSDPAVRRALRDYLALVVQPAIDRMSDGDPEPRRALAELRSRLEGRDGAANVLRHRIDDVLDTFYG
jgi:hypothetical protein